MIYYQSSERHSVLPFLSFLARMNLRPPDVFFILISNVSFRNVENIIKMAQRCTLTQAYVFVVISLLDSVE